MTDRDEARFAQATYQMLESGDYWRIAFQDEPRTKKPHGIHWLQSLSVMGLSEIEAKEIWAYRAPSAFGAWLAVVLLYLLASDLFGRRTGLLAGLFLAATPLLIAEAHIATADAALIACILAAQSALARCYVAGQRDRPAGPGNAALFWLALLAAALIKGPVGPAVAGLTVAGLVAFDRRARWLLQLRPLAGVALFAASLVLWAWWAAEANDGAFATAALAEDFLPKLLAGQESHGAPPGTHLLVATVALGPAFPVVLFGILHAARHRSRPELRFCLAWLIPSWIVVELVATKLPHYTLPIYPALAILSAIAVVSGAAAGRAGRVAIIAWSVLVAVAALMAIAGQWIVMAESPIAGHDILATAALILVGSLCVAALAWLRSLSAAVVMSLAAWTTVCVTLLALAGPRLAPLWISERIAAATAEHGGIPAGGFVSVGYEEPSLVFVMGTNTEFLAPDAAAARAAAASPPTIAVDDANRDAFESEMRRLGAEIPPTEGVGGFHYSKGRWTTVWLYIPKNE